MEEGQTNSTYDPARFYVVSNSSDNPTPNTHASHLGSGAKRRPIGKPPAATPSWHTAQLQRWLQEWNIYRALESSPTEAKDDQPVMPYALPAASGVELPPGLVPPFESTPESFEPGVIRLLDSALLPGAQRPVYVLILADWADGRKLVAPFGPFSTPASTMELQSNREEPHLAVICLWNARVLSTETLARSWFVERFEEDELDDVLAVWESGMFAGVLPAHLHSLIGPPIENQDDARCEYQNEEVSLFAAIDAEMLTSTRFEEGEFSAAASNNQPVPSDGAGSRITDWVSTLFLVDVIEWLEDQTLPAVAAGSLRRPPFRRKRYTIVGTPLILSIKTEPQGTLCHVTVLEDDEPSNKLDGAHLLPHAGEAIRIAGGHAACSTLALKGGFKLIGSNETALELEAVS